MVVVHFVHSAGRWGVWRAVIKASQTNGWHTVLTALLSFSRVSIRFTTSSKSCFWNKQSNVPYTLQPVSQHVHCSYSVPHLHQIPIIIITTLKCYCCCNTLSLLQYVSQNIWNGLLKMHIFKTQYFRTDSTMPCPLSGHSSLWCSKRHGIVWDF